jgi:hypothetical protein
MRRLICALFLTSACGGIASGQTLSHRPAASGAPTSDAPAPVAPVSVPLTLPAGMPLQVALDKEIRIQKVGQPIHGKVVEPAYAFDKLVVPAGSEVTGTVIALQNQSGKQRTMAALNGNFTPYRNVQVEFNELVLPDGRRVPMQTIVSPGSQGVLQFSTAKSKDEKENRAKKVASDQVNAKKDEIKRDWENAKKQISAPGKMHRLERYGQAILPVHPQYMEAGTRFNAELKAPLNFGSETLTPEMISAVGTPPPDGSIVHAMLLTPLSSATSQKDAPVEAIITEPLFVSDHLILPQGSKLIGAVLEARPARKFAHTGQLRIVFHQVVPPNGLEQRVEASLEGVEAEKDGGNRLKLDSEGGAEVTQPKTRYSTTAISIFLAATSFRTDIDKGVQEHPGGTFGSRAANGGSGFGVIGFAVGALAHSRVLASTMGIYGAATTVYSRFIARGSDVVYPKYTVMAIGIGTRAPHPVKPTASPAAPAGGPTQPPSPQ